MQKNNPKHSKNKLAQPKLHSRPATAAVTLPPNQIVTARAHALSLTKSQLVGKLRGRADTLPVLHGAQAQGARPGQRSAASGRQAARSDLPLSR